MLDKWFITGDTHGDFSRFYKLNNDAIAAGETYGVIILGDVGLNYWLSKRDQKNKYRICDKYSKLRFYCVRGNHEARPEDVEDMETWFDEDVKGDVFVEPKYPNIKYLKDGHDYEFGGYYTIVIGGAYSVDKYYRLERAAAGGYAGWFENEQLTEKERDLISWKVKQYGPFDLVLSHTCPISWQPTDLFLNCVNQSSVDNSMELWLDDLSRSIKWNVWLFGHYHADRLERPCVEMFYSDIENLEDIMKRWKKYKETNELDWWLDKSPNFYWT